MQKHLLKNAVSFLITNSIFLSLDSVAMLWVSFLFFDVVPIPTLLCAMFLVVYSVYSLNRLTDQEEDAVNAPERSIFVEGNERFLLTTAIASYIVALVLGWIESPFAALILTFPIMLGRVYSKNVFSMLGLPRLKNIFIIKNLTISIGWAVCVTFLPALYISGNASMIVLFFTFFAVKIFIDSVVFDVRDVEGDVLCGVKTIPAVIGVRKTCYVLLILNSFLAVLILFFIDFMGRYSSILLISIIYGYAYILYFCREPSRNRILFDWIVDGEWTFILILTYIILI